MLEGGVIKVRRSREGRTSMHAWKDGRMARKKEGMGPPLCGYSKVMDVDLHEVYRCKHVVTRRIMVQRRECFMFRVSQTDGVNGMSMN